MMIVLKILVFILGTYLSIRLVAALFRLIDLWYMIRKALPKVIMGIIMWGGVAVIIGLLLGPLFRGSFLWGLVVYPIFYLAVFMLNKINSERAIRPTESD